MPYGSLCNCPIRCWHTYLPYLVPAHVSGVCTCQVPALPLPALRLHHCAWQQHTLGSMLKLNLARLPHAFQLLHHSWLTPHPKPSPTNKSLIRFKFFLEVSLFVAEVAYPNLLGTERLCCCCCFLGRWERGQPWGPLVVCSLSGEMQKVEKE